MKSPAPAGLFVREMLPRVVRSTIAIGLSLAGVACGLTLVYLSMRAVMDVGGFCAEGGPFEIQTHCPQGVPGIMVGSLLGGIVLAFVYVGVAVWRRVPSFAMLPWPALFLSLGWNFLEYAFDPPGTGGGVVWGWLICGIVFMLMGGLPLLVILPRRFAGSRANRSRLAVGPSGCRSPRCSVPQPGSLTDDVYAAAKARLL